ncbi:hypothetical protein, partial [Hymenobacter ginkgonis]|uniref:hypothetical protein n=1 Tax=Hymenobacter ginkgonis TaxID=2682976 RepID=UPI0018DC67B9
MKNILRVCAFLSLLLVAAAFLLPHEAVQLAHYLAPAHGPALLAALTGIGSGATLACVVVPIEAIVLDDCPNPGGLTDIHVIRRRDIETWPEVDADKVTISTALVPKTGKKFVPWEFA